MASALDDEADPFGAPEFDNVIPLGRAERFAQMDEALEAMFDNADRRKRGEWVDRSEKRADSRSHRAGGDSLPTSGVNLTDFWAYMPEHKYIFEPSGDFWPAQSVNNRLPKVMLRQDDGTPVYGDDNKPIMLKAADWLDRKRPVEQMTWAPGMPKIIPDRLIADGGWLHRSGVSCYNQYRPAVTQPGDPAKAGPWIDHLRRIYPTDADHLICWLAHRVQRPQDKINHAIVLGGSQGIGKDTILEPVKYAIGPWNLSEVGPKEIMGEFRGFLKSVILRISEARDLGDIDRFAFYDHLKTYTAAPPDVLRINEKYIREYNIFNVVGIIITTNHRTDGIFLPPDDRRHYVTWSEAMKEDFSPEYWMKLWGWYVDGGGFQHTAAYLRSVDISGWNPKAPPPQTEAFWAIVQSSQAPENAELRDALDALGNPSAVTIREVALYASDELKTFLSDRRNSRKFPHRFGECGYERVRNCGAADGDWKVGAVRMPIYAKKCLSEQARQAAAAGVVAAGRVARGDPII